MAISVVLVSCAGSQEKLAKESWRSVAATVYEPSTSEEARDIALPDSADFYQLLRYAALHNPGVEASFYHWKAAVERIPQARALPDPNFRFGYFFEEVETRVGPQKQSFGLAQMFPWFGTLRLKGDIAAQNAFAAQERFHAARDRLYLEVARGYSEFYYLARSTNITEELLELIKNTEAVAQAKYRAGYGPYADIMRAQVELGKLEDQLLAFRDQQTPVKARLNAALNRPLDAPLAPPENLPNETLALADDELLARASRDNPSLREMDRRIASSESAIGLAARKFYPNFTVGVDHLNTDLARMPGVTGSGKDPVIGRVAINIPIWQGSYRAARREAQARRKAAQLDRADRENTILSEVRRVLFHFHDAERKLELYSDILIPKARQSLEASQAGYEAGEIDFLNFLDAERALLEFELAFDRARADHLVRLAELRMLAGGAYETLADQPR